jgi:hypothetical protein
MQQCADEMKAELPYFQRVSPYSDHWPFFLKGVPCGSGGDPELIRTSMGRGFGHSQYDTVDKVELEYLRLGAANYTRFLYRIANADDWKPRRKPRTRSRSSSRNRDTIRPFSSPKKSKRTSEPGSKSTPIQRIGLRANQTGKPNQYRARDR